MRSVFFNAYYWVLSIFYGLSAAFAALAPGREAVTFTLRLYSRRILWALDALAGVKVQVKGQENLPAGPCIIAAKHHSWGDGFVMFAHVDNLSFVTGDHLEKFPLLGTVLQKLGAIVVNNCGGHEARKALAQSAAIAHEQGRKILIYPEGNLARVGEKYRYRSGVWHMYRDFDMPVVPLATNLGLFWPGEEFRKHPGTATLAFLNPIPVGLPKDEFLARLEAAVENKTAELVAEATGQPATPAVRILAPDEARRAAAMASSAS